MLIGPAAAINILSSNVNVTDEGIIQWTANGDVELSLEVQKGDDIFESLTVNNNAEPVAETTTLEYKYLRKSNRLKMFDPYINTKTVRADNLTYELAVSDIDMVAFFGLEAKSVRVEMFNATGTSFYDKTIVTYDRDTTDWASWSTASAEFSTNAFFKDLPFIFDAKLKITIENTGSLVKCGHCAFAESKNLGITLADPKPISSIRNIINKEKLPDGTIKTENSMTYKRVVANVLLDTNRASEVQNILEKYTVTPCIYVADEREGGVDTLLTFGLYKDFDMPIGINKTQYQLEIEGVI